LARTADPRLYFGIVGGSIVLVCWPILYSPSIRSSKMSKILTSMSTVALACLVSAASFAADDDAAAKRKAAMEKRAKMFQEQFKKLDTNGDGQLSFDEYKGKRKKPEAVEKAEQIFKLLDKSGDLKLTLEEFKNRSVEVRFKMMDKDGNGKLTFDEFKGRREKPEDIEKAEQMFKRMDKDGDGKVTLEEMKQALKKRKPAKK